MGQDETSMSDSIVPASAFNLIIGLFFKEEKNKFSIAWPKGGFVLNYLAFNFPE